MGWTLFNTAIAFSLSSFSLFSRSPSPLFCILSQMVALRVRPSSLLVESNEPPLSQPFSEDIATPMEAACRLSLSHHDVDGALVPGLSESSLATSTRAFQQGHSFSCPSLTLTSWQVSFGKVYFFRVCSLKGQMCAPFLMVNFHSCKFLMIPLSKVWQFFRKVSRETNLCCTYFNFIQVSLSPLQQK